ncbi:hypothetical protein H5410_033023 [Solanum commersonii]|uniref:Uncharacterized protein n=1 Tax=Solanum commersonii TaxID=4109 RepID=A0A9J5YNX8_SOLCO|nr:hypothetical protein H5410_033023 [Solanum commersonii]
MILHQTKLIEHVWTSNNRRRSRRLQPDERGQVELFSAIVGKITVVATLNNMPSIFPRVGSGEGGM